MIRPIDEYSGEVAAPSTEYPDGKAQNITSPGDGTGTPWEAKLINDIFGFQQYITSNAGITPSGTPDDAVTNQQFEALWKLLNVRPVVINVTSDADITLTTTQNLYAKLTITDTGALLTTGRNVRVDTIGRMIIFTNDTAQTLTVKTTTGAGVPVDAGESAVLVCDETDVIDFADFAGGEFDIHTLAAKTTPVNTDELTLADSAAAWQLKKVTWSNIKATLKTYFDTLYNLYTDSSVLSLFNVSGSAPVFAARTLVNFNGTGTVAIRASGNVSSVTDNGTGQYTVNFSTAMSDSNYCVSGTVRGTVDGVDQNKRVLVGLVWATTSIKVGVVAGLNQGVDDDTVNVAVHG